MVKDTQFCLVGNNLCYLQKKSKHIQILKLKGDQSNFYEGLIPTIRYPIETMIDRDEDL